MVLHCVVPECQNDTSTPGISFHRFPLDEAKKKAWCIRMRCHGKIAPSMRICSAHFLPEDYKYVTNSKKYLKESAEPSVFPYDTSEESETYFLSPPKSRKKAKAQPKDKVVVPALENFLEVPLEYIRNKKKANQYFQLKGKSALFPFKVDKNIQDSSIQKESHQTLNVSFNQSHSVFDPKVLKWLKKSKRTQKTFFNYFEAGMSPSAAIQHHANLLSFQNPDFLNDSKRNPPKGWVHSLYDSWRKVKEGNGKLGIADKCNTFCVKPNAVVTVPCKNEVDRVAQEKNSSAPCVFHNNNHPMDDYEDLKHLPIPDEVKELFYKYFNDGLDVSEAMKLNEENLKRNRNWPQFNPSKRVINYIYQIWQEKIKTCNPSNKDSGFVSFNENNCMDCNSVFENLSKEINCQNVIDNFTGTSQLRTTSSFEKSIAILPQAEVNCSSETSMEILPFPFTPPSSSSNPLTLTENGSMEHEAVKDTFAQPGKKLCEEMSMPQKPVYVFDSVQNQYIPISSQTSIYSQNSTPTFMNSLNSKNSFSNQQISAASVITNTKIFSSLNDSSVSFHMEKNKELNSQNSVISQNSTSALVNSFNTKSNFSNEQVSATSVITNLKTCSSLNDSSVSSHVEKNQEINSQNSVSSENSTPALMNSPNIKNNFSNQQISVSSIKINTKTFSSLNDSSVSVHVKKNQEVTLQNSNHFQNSTPALVNNSLNNESNFSIEQISTNSVINNTKTFKTFNNSINESSVSVHMEKSEEINSQNFVSSKNSISSLMNMFNTKSNFSNEPVSATSVMPNAQTFYSLNDNSVSVHVEKNQEVTLQNSNHFQNSTPALVNSLNNESNFSIEQISANSVINNTKTFKTFNNSINESPVSVHVEKSEEINSQNSISSKNSISSLMDMFNTKSNFSNEPVSATSVMPNAQTFNSINDSSLSVHVEKNQEVTLQNSNHFQNSTPALVNSLNNESNFSIEQISANSVINNTKTFKTFNNCINESSVSVHVEKSEEINSQNSISSKNSKSSLIDLFNTKSNFSNEPVSATSVMPNAQTFNSINDSSLSVHVEKNQKISLQNSNCSQNSTQAVVNSFNTKSNFSNEPVSAPSIINDTQTFSSLNDSSLSVHVEKNELSSQNSNFCQNSTPPLVNSFTMKSNFSNEPVSSTSIITNTKTFNCPSDSSVSAHEAKNQDLSLQNFIHSQNSTPAFMNSFNIKNNFSCEPVSATSIITNTETFNYPNDSSVSVYVGKNQEISLQNSICSHTSTPALVNSFNINHDLNNEQISAISVMTETKTFNSVTDSSVLFHAEKMEELCSDLSKPYYTSKVSNKRPFQTLPESSKRSCQITFSDSFNELKVSNYCEPPMVKYSSIIHPSTIYSSNVSFGLNSESYGNGHHSFYPFVDKYSESFPRMMGDVKKLNHIYSATQLDSRPNVFSSSSPTSINGYAIFKEMPDKPKINNFMESEELNFVPSNMDMMFINSRNNEMPMSFIDEENEEYNEVRGTSSLKIAPLELSKQNEDQKFLLSLLPEFETIPDCFKAILKNDIFNLVHSAKLRADKWHPDCNC